MFFLAEANPRGHLIILLLAATALVACDSESSGPPPSDLEGTYVFTRLEFTVAGVDNFDVLADTLVTSETSPRMEFFGGNATVNLVYRVEGSAGSSLLSGQFTTGDRRVTADLSGAPREDRFQLLLPPILRLQSMDNNTRLVADQEVRDVNLREYSPGRYGGLTQNVDGTLHLRLERLQP